MADIEAKVAEWLEKQGFPLEFRTANVLAQSGFNIDQGAYFVDPKEDALREIDVIASITRQTEARTYQFSLVVECKWSRDLPWVVFTSSRKRPTLSAYMARLLASPFAEAVLWYVAATPRVAQSGFSDMPRRFGFGGRQLSDRGERDLFYSALQSVTAAATAIAHERPSSLSSNHDYVRLFRVVIPTIVLDGSLVEAFLDGEELKVVRLDRAIVAWRGFATRQEPVFVNIVTLDALSKYADEHFQFGGNLRHLTSPFAENIAKAVISRDPKDLPNADHTEDVPVPWLLSGIAR